MNHTFANLQTFCNFPHTNTLIMHFDNLLLSAFHCCMWVWRTVPKIAVNGTEPFMPRDFDLHCSDALGLTEVAGDIFQDSRTGKRGVF